jgi:flagellar motility protein MotE (MotC chaperone)
MTKIPTPRLLPATMATMAALLVLKCGVIVQAVVTHGSALEAGMVAAANAASSEETKEHAKPATNAKTAPPAQQPPATQSINASSPPSVPEGPPPVSDSEKALLQELRQRRQDLDQRAAAVASGESVLTATEQKLAARVAELQALQKNLEGLDSAQKQKEDAGWQGLVKLYETMKAKDAAAIFNDMSMPVLTQIMDRMKDAKAASVMATMNPDKARDLTAELAQMRTGRDTSGAPLAAAKSSLAGG